MFTYSSCLAGATQFLFNNLSFHLLIDSTFLNIAQVLRPGMENILNRDQSANHLDSLPRLLTLQAQMAIYIFNFSNLLTKDQTRQKEGYYSLKN